MKPKSSKRDQKVKSGRQKKSTCIVVARRDNQKWQLCCNLKAEKAVDMTNFYENVLNAVCNYDKLLSGSDRNVSCIQSKKQLLLLLFCLAYQKSLPCDP